MIDVRVMSLPSRQEDAIIDIAVILGELWW